VDGISHYGLSNLRRSERSGPTGELKKNRIGLSSSKPNSNDFPQFAAVKLTER
jgi:hypothetical protein